MCFFLNDTATTEIYTYSHTLSLHDALPISAAAHPPIESRPRAAAIADAVAVHQRREAAMESSGSRAVHIARGTRSEEHTSELQSLMRISYAVFCLKKQTATSQQRNKHIRNTLISSESSQTHPHSTQPIANTNIA